MLAPGQSILFFTDGVTEEGNESDELFSYQRLIDHIGGGSGPPWGKKIVEAVKSWRGNTKASDDLTIFEIWRDSSNDDVNTAAGLLNT